jgi:hypothetical protein
MKTFDIHRFGKVLKWTLYYNKSTLTKIIMGFFIAFLALYLLSTDLLFSANSSFPDRLTVAEGCTLGVLVVFLFLTPSWILSNMKDRKSSLDYLMLPATNLEKFLARIVTVTVFYTLCLIAAQIAADLIQWVISLFRYPISQTGLISINLLENHSIHFCEITNGADSYGRGVSYVILGNLMVLTWMVWMHSVYTLGGTVFRKRAWIITSFILLGLGFFITFLVVKISSGIMNWSDNVYEVSTMAIGIIIVIISLLLAALNYFLSYKVFCRMQLINNKWVNL